MPTISTLDAVNSGLQLGGAVATWANVTKLLDDKLVRGVQFGSIAFFALWGFWNVYYFWELGQWLSAASGVVLASGNAVWILLVLWYRRGYGASWR